MHVWGRVWDSIEDGSQAVLEQQAVQWLKAHSLEKYKDQLALQGVKKLQDMQDVNEEILGSCGFTPFDKAKFIARRGERPNRESAQRTETAEDVITAFVIFLCYGILILFQ